jgi:hypothetical protein
MTRLTFKQYFAITITVIVSFYEKQFFILRRMRYYLIRRVQRLRCSIFQTFISLAIVTSQIRRPSNLGCWGFFLVFFRT